MLLLILLHCVVLCGRRLPSKQDELRLLGRELANGRTNGINNQQKRILLIVQTHCSRCSNDAGNLIMKIKLIAVQISVAIQVPTNCECGVGG